MLHSTAGVGKRRPYIPADSHYLIVGASLDEARLTADGRR